MLQNLFLLIPRFKEALTEPTVPTFSQNVNDQALYCFQSIWIFQKNLLPLDLFIIQTLISVSQNYQTALHLYSQQNLIGRISTLQPLHHFSVGIVGLLRIWSEFNCQKSD